MFCPLTETIIEGDHRGMSKQLNLSTTEFEFIATTCVALSMGAALLLGDRPGARQRKAAGWTLLGVGAVTSVPIFMRIYGPRERSNEKRAGSHERFVEEQHA